MPEATPRALFPPTVPMLVPPTTMSEWQIIALVTLGPCLWALGGTGWKPARRYVWPLAAGLLLWRPWGIASALSIAATATLPYGDRTPWPMKALIFASYGLPVCWLDWRFGLWWALGMGVVLACLMRLSQGHNRVSHKIFEFSCGALQSVGIVLGCLR